MNTPLVSIIIPNYNNEKYLPKCLDSVINQTYNNLEIIVVNDGSTDGSMSIIKDFMSRDGRIKCIDQQNKGLAIARKNGLDMASGEWIQHLDSDDFLETDGIERLVKRAAESGADIVTSPFFFYYNDGSKTESLIPDFDCIGGKDFLKLIICGGKGYWSMWANFHKRSLAYSHDIEIIPVNVGEDARFMSQILLDNPKVAAIRHCILNYRQNPASMMNAPKYNRQKIEALRHLQDFIIDKIDRKGLTEEFDTTISQLRINTFYHCLVGHYTDFSKEELKELEHAFMTTSTYSGRSKGRSYKLMRAFRLNRYLGKLLYRYYVLKKKY